MTDRRAPRLRMVLRLAGVEASLLVRSVLVLAGVLAGGLVTWLFIHRAEPLWWDVSWRIGGGELVLGMAVLVAAQLAAGRARRNGMADLYASFPATTGTRTVAHLAGLAGALPAGLLLIGAVAVVVRLRGAIGTPDVAVLAGGLLLVIAAGAVGVAIGSRFPHPLAGMLGALALLLSSGTSHVATGAATWLAPWQLVGLQLDVLPGPLAGYPPAGGHALELAGLAVLAGVVALVRARGGFVVAGAAAVAVICLAGALQLRPIPATDLNQLVTEVADPASVQHCTAEGRARFCFYPGFGGQLPAVAAPVDAVLAHLPVRTGRSLTVRQVVPLSLPDSALTHGHPAGQVSQWIARVNQAPGDVAIDLPVGAWPPAGDQLTDAQFDLALAAAEWAVDLPGADGGIGESMPCVPADQAREAVAIWLAIVATHPPAGELRSGLGTGIEGIAVGGSFVRTWYYPGAAAGGGITPPGGRTQNTAAGYQLADAMTGLPQQRVSAVLAGAWGRWLDQHTTDAQLAAALGIPVPGSAAPGQPTGGPQSLPCAP